VSSVEIAGLSIVAALVFIIVQHVLIRRRDDQIDRMHDTIVGITLGEIETKVDGDDILIRKVRDI